MKLSEKKEPKVYQFMDGSIAFSVCDLDGATHPGNCQNPIVRQDSWDNGGKPIYYCGNCGLHFHCNKHTNEFLYKKTITESTRMDGSWDGVDSFETTREVWWCDKCEIEDKNYSGHVFDEDEQTRRARAFIASEEYKKAQVVRIDDQLVQIEFKKAKTPKGESDYYTAWGNIETDKNGNPQINLYIALKSMGGKKVHYFIEPELGRLREEVRGIDIDPGEIISKIEITTRGSKIVKEYASEDNVT